MHKSIGDTNRGIIRRESELCKSLQFTPSVQIRKSPLFCASIAPITPLTRDLNIFLCEPGTRRSQFTNLSNLAAPRKTYTNNIPISPFAVVLSIIIIIIIIIVSSGITQKHVCCDGNRRLASVLHQGKKPFPGTAQRAIWTAHNTSIICLSIGRALLAQFARRSNPNLRNTPCGTNTHTTSPCAVQRYICAAAAHICVMWKSSPGYLLVLRPYAPLVFFSAPETLP